MAMHYKEVPNGISQDEAIKYARGITSVADFVDFLQSKGELPEEFATKPKTIKTPKIEVARLPLSRETQRLVEHLRKDGYTVYDYSGRTPAQVRVDGMRFWYLNPALEDLSSNPALLAFKPAPEGFYLRGSQNIPHERQLELLAEEAAGVEKKYPSARLITREWHAPEIIDVSLQHFRNTGDRLQGKDFGYNYTWTDTYTSDKQGADRAFVGGWNEVYGLSAYFWYPGNVYPHLGLASVVEILRK